MENVFICKHSQHLLSRVAVHFSMATAITMHVCNDEVKNAISIESWTFMWEKIHCLAWELTLRTSYIFFFTFLFIVWRFCQGKHVWIATAFVFLNFTLIITFHALIFCISSYFLFREFNTFVFKPSVSYRSKFFSSVNSDDFTVTILLPSWLESGERKSGQLHSNCNHNGSLPPEQNTPYTSHEVYFEDTHCNE